MHSVCFLIIDLPEINLYGKLILAITLNQLPERFRKHLNFSLLGSGSFKKYMSIYVYCLIGLIEQLIRMRTKFVDLFVIGTLKVSSKVTN